MSTRFERNLYFAILGTKPPRMPRRKARRGPARDAAYRAWIRTLKCETCGATPCEAAHVGLDGGMGMKCSDYSTVPLCWRCHRVGRYSYHMAGAKTFSAMYCLDFRAIVERLNSVWGQLNRVKVFGRAQK
jgi:hypothetical protein